MDPILGGALIKGAATGLAALGGRSGGFNRGDYRTQLTMQRKYERAMLRNKFKWLSQGARAGGFNPLTALGSGGVASSGSNPYQHVSQPLSVGGAVGEALATGVDSYLSYDPIYEESRRLDIALKKQELATGKAQAARLGSGVPQVSSTASEVETIGGSEDVPEPGRLTVTNPEYRGSGHKVNPRSPDADTSEARYSDLGGAVAFATNSARDAWYQHKDRGLVRQYGQDFADTVHDRYGKEIDSSWREIVKDEKRRRGIPDRTFPLELSIPAPSSSTSDDAGWGGYTYDPSHF